MRATCTVIFLLCLGVYLFGLFGPHAWEAKRRAIANGHPCAPETTFSLLAFIIMPVLLLVCSLTKLAGLLRPHAAGLVRVECVFAAVSAQGSAGMSPAITHALRDTIGHTLLNPVKYDNPAAFARRKAVSAQAAVERVLNAPPGSCHVVDRQMLVAWFED
jgi:hypothetical protein